MHMTKSIKISIGFGLSVLIILLSVIVIRAFYLGTQPQNCIVPVDPNNVGQTAPFNKPGLHKVYRKGWNYELIVVASAFTIYPRTVQIPLGSKVKIIATSKDVIHGLTGAGTNIHMMLEPGYVNVNTTTFLKRGEYLLICSSYCGSGHKLMTSKIKVVNN
jgi:cytochrome c oxidase subunit 2